MGTPSAKAIAIVKEVLVVALGVEEREVVPDAILVDQLGAESIDFLDIHFRLEKAIPAKIDRQMWATWIVKDKLTAKDCDPAYRPTATGKKKLEAMFPNLEIPDGKLYRSDWGMFIPVTAGMLMTYLDEHVLNK